MKLSRYLLISSSLSFVYFNAHADTMNNSSFPLNPRINMTGSLGGEDNRLINGDGFIPVWGDFDHIFYTDIQAKTGFNTTWNASLGAGYRQNYQDSNILGAYAFIDRSVSDQKHTFWVANPGIESLGTVWDFRANAYIPVSSQNAFIEQGWADNFGNYSAVNFSGHTQYDQMAQLYQNIGPGADIEAGRTIPNLQGLSAYLGAYAYDVKTDDEAHLHGAEGRVEYTVNKYTAVDLQDTYDNIQHNTVGLSVRVSLGGLGNSMDHTDINSRMEDPIQRNMATFMQGNSAPTGTTTKLVGPMMAERDNIWFFNSSTGSSTNSLLGASQITASSCTYEHPCNGSSFNQSTINAINNIAPNANYYLSSGTYNSFNDQLDLFSGQSLYGRTDNYVQPASGSARPTLVGQIDLPGSNMIDSIQLMNDPNNPQLYAIYMNNSNNVVLNNILVGPNLLTNPSNLSNEYIDGIYMEGSTNSLTINNSIINAYADSAPPTKFEPESPVINADGISDHSTSSATIVLNNSSINATASSAIETLAEGITDKIGAGYITLNNSSINTQVSSSNNSSYAYGIDGAAGNNYVNINNSTINTSSSSIGHQADARGIFLSNDNNVVTMNNSTINATATSTTSTANAYGINPYNSFSTVDINNSTINATARTTSSSSSINNAYGIYSDGVQNNISVANSTLNVSATQTGGRANAYGVLGGTPDIFGGTNNISINDSTINSTAASTTGSAYAYGVAGYEISDTITINNSAINSDASSTSNLSYAAGVYSRAFGGTNVLNITNSSLYALARSTSGSASADDIFARANNNSQNTVNILNTVMNAYASNSGATCHLRQNLTCIL